jgi:hypothetical protein
MRRVPLDDHQVRAMLHVIRFYTEMDIWSRRRKPFGSIGNEASPSLG